MYYIRRLYIQYFLKPLGKGSIFLKKVLRAYSNEPSKVSVLRKSSHLNNSLKVYKNKYFCQLLRVLLSLTLLFIFWLHNLKGRAWKCQNALSNFSDGLFEETLSRAWFWILAVVSDMGEALDIEFQIVKSSWCSKEKPIPRMLLGGPCEKKRHYERKQWKLCVTNSCDFPSYASKCRQDYKYRLSQHCLSASSFFVFLMLVCQRR